MRLVSLHATHQTVPLAELSPLCALPTGSLLGELACADGIDEVVVLSTCNRFEVYLAASDPVAAHAAAFTVLSKHAPLPNGIVVRKGVDTMVHLLRVSSGIDSLMVGEDQILGQVKAAFVEAQEARTVGPALTGAFERALVIGKRVRSETRINRGAVSIGSAAVLLAEQSLGSLHGKRVALVGTGEIATLVARSLAGRGSHTTVVAHRDFAHARQLARELGGAAVGFSDLRSLLPESDAIIAAVSSPEPILSAGDLAEAKEGLLLIDLGNPPNIDPAAAQLSRVRIQTLENMRRLADDNLAKRRAEVASVEAILRSEIERLAARERSVEAARVVGSLHERAQAIAREEVGKAARKLGVEGREREVLEHLASTALKRILAEPQRALKVAGEAGDETTVATLARAFAIEADPARDPDAEAPNRTGGIASRTRTARKRDPAAGRLAR